MLICAYNLAKSTFPHEAIMDKALTKTRADCFPSLTVIYSHDISVEIQFGDKNIRLNDLTKDNLQELKHSFIKFAKDLENL
jgi:hypothetical protein